MTRNATVTYLYHSGMLVAVEDTLLLFDYWQGDHGEFSEASARMLAEEMAKAARIVMFVSHKHPDHFDPAIYAFPKSLPISYVVSEDMPIGVRGKRMKEGDVYAIGDITVKAFGSTDTGVSYLVTVGDLTVFHAGDLNLWHWREESTSHEILKAERAFYAAVKPIERERVDIAMFPVDPRMGGLYDAGANYFVMAVKPRVFIPMHWWKKVEAATDYARRGRTKYTEVVALTRTWESAELSIADDGKLVVRRLEPRGVEDAPPQDDSDCEMRAYAEGDPFSDTDLPVQLD